jgi:hypothetical protein
MLLLPVALAAALAMAPRPSVLSEVVHRREHVGQCFRTRVRSVTTRLGEADGTPVPNSGSAITLADGHRNVSYDRLPGIDRSQPGDLVRLCVTALPTNCPPGDHRGIKYRGRNLRTGLSWVAPDAEHMCGGA